MKAQHFLALGNAICSEMKVRELYIFRFITRMLYLASLNEIRRWMKHNQSVKIMKFQAQV